MDKKPGKRPVGLPGKSERNFIGSMDVVGNHKLDEDFARYLEDRLEAGEGNRSATRAARKIIRKIRGRRGD